MKKIFQLLFISIILVSSIIAQPKPQFRPIHFEHHTFNYGSYNICFISYKISYNNLIFVKQNSHYSAGISINFEATQEGSDKIVRDSEVRSVSVEDYMKTNSDSEYLDGIISLNLEAGKYKITPKIVLENTNQPYKLKPFYVKVEEEIIKKPLVVFDHSVDDHSKWRLVNYNESIPYSAKPFSLIVPVENTDSIEIAKLSIKQNGKTVYNKNQESSRIGNLRIKNIENDIEVVQVDSDKYKLFMFDSVNIKLTEGRAELLLSAGSKEKKYNFNVEWINKPRTLRMGEIAADLLKVMIDRDKIDEIKDDSELLQKRLFEFWKEMDPNKDTGFNELMHEFYRRADYALVKFATAHNKNGALSDRGLIYIKYGKPDDIQRVYTERNDINEIWIYSKINKEFVFTDKNGLGDYKLVKE